MHPFAKSADVVAISRQLVVPVYNPKIEYSGPYREDVRSSVFRYFFFCFKSPKQWTGLFWFQTNFTEPFPFCFICWYVFNWRYVKYLQLLTSILFLTMISTAITSSPPPLTSTCSIRPYVKKHFEKKFETTGSIIILYMNCSRPWFLWSFF